MNYEVKQTEEFAEWLESIRDFVAKKLVYARVARLKFGNFGDVKSVGDGVSELRIHHGPGYRVYFGKDGGYIVLLLCGGTKNRQVTDVLLAKRLFNEVKNER